MILDSEGKVKPIAQFMKEMRCEYFRQLLVLTKGRVTEAAQLSHRNRTEIYRSFSRAGFSISAFRKQQKEST